MTSTDRLAEMAAEIERLRCEVITAKGMKRFWQVISEGKDAEIERLRDEMAQLKGLMLQSSQIWQTENSRLLARVAELEGNAAVTFGTLERPTPDEPARYTHDSPPSAPPHDE